MSRSSLLPQVATGSALSMGTPAGVQYAPAGPSRPVDAGALDLKKEMISIIFDEIQGLEPRDRQLLALSLGARLSSEEIAEFLAWPAEAVTLALARLRCRLGRALGPHCAAPDADGWSQAAELLVTEALLASFPPPPDLYHKVLARLQAREQELSQQRARGSCPPPGSAQILAGMAFVAALVLAFSGGRASSAFLGAQALPSTHEVSPHA